MHPPPPRQPQRGRWAEGAAVLARPRPQAGLRLYEWTRAGDPSSRPLQSLSGICPARGRGLPLPRTTSTPSSHPTPTHSKLSDTPSPRMSTCLPGSPDQRGKGLLPDLKADGGVGDLDPGLDQGSTLPPPESLPSVLTQREPRTAPGHIHRALPPAFSSLLCVCRPPTLTSAPRGQGLCVPPVPWQLHQDRPSTWHTLPPGQAKHAARTAQGHI